MIFNSVEFLIFFPIVVLLLFVMPQKLRLVWLLIVNYYFYTSWNAKYLFIIVGITIITYFGACLIEKLENQKKRILVSTIVLCLTCLLFFKYAYFVLDNLNYVLEKIDAQTISLGIDIVLPVGISFYIFSSMGYVIDVYKGKEKAETNFIRYATFVSFFPSLCAGPIERAKNILPQLKEYGNLKLWNYERVTQGLVIMLWGFFQKMVIADRLAILVDNIFVNYMVFNSTALIIGAIGFSIQIYCDFSSYSTIAKGVAKVMGIKLIDNFDIPYASKSIKEFWRRWHISLSTWFRDYVYIPLGGNRCGKVRNNINLLITFMLSGLWHGSSWTFVIWGLLHGIYQIVENLTKTTREKLYAKLNCKTESFSFKLGQMLCTFVLITVAWIFFKATSVEQAVIYITRMFTKVDLWTLFDGGLNLLGLAEVEWNVLLIALLVLLIVDVLQNKSKECISVILSRETIVFRWIVLIAMIFSILVFGVYGPSFSESSFIYFNF